VDGREDIQGGEIEMHIIAPTNEIALIKELKLPDNTTIVETDSNNDEVLYRWRVKKGQLCLEVDFKDIARDWVDEKEYKDFVDNFGTGNKLKINLINAGCNLNDDTPEREYSTTVSLFNDTFKNILFSELMYDESVVGQIIPRFEVRLQNTFSDVKKECELFLRTIKSIYTSRLDKFVFFVSGTRRCVHVYWNFKNSFDVVDGRKTLDTRIGLHSLLNYLFVLCMV